MLAIAVVVPLIANLIYLAEARATSKNVPVVNSTVLGANLVLPQFVSLREEG
jgi:hypothetical protein